MQYVRGMKTHPSRAFRRALPLLLVVTTVALSACVASVDAEDEPTADAESLATEVDAVSCSADGADAGAPSTTPEGTCNTPECKKLGGGTHH